jgi:hypothetical protein
MRVGVVSDSHGEVDNLRDGARFLVDKQKVEVLVHLGDDYDDAVILEELGVGIIRVPGVFSKYYQDHDVPNRVVEIFDNKMVLITHTDCCHENDLPDDVKPENLVQEKVVDMVLHGHTHIPGIELKHGVVFVNPGHLKTEDKKGYPPSVAVVDFTDKICVDIYTLDGELLQSKTFYG